ncbi:MAG: YXWGXW repeat-containing protein [Dyella sp.]|uniref:YXWGXW repeat-containing protein n=1 Tax=Dyella sp. TaxID=1869338 RepID=UPI003F80CA4F
MISMTRKLALVAGIGLALAGVSYTPPATAQVSVGVGIRVAPPAPRYERMPPARRGFIWSQGYWRWEPRVHRYVWVPGTWVRARAGYRWYPGVWVRRGPNWYWRDGYWGR